MSTKAYAVVGYVRVSTSEQADSGAGLEAQRAAIEAETGRRGWTLLTIHEDAGASGKSLNGRPGLQGALQAVELGDAQALVVHKLDRLSRSVHDFAGLVARAQRKGWAGARCARPRPRHDDACGRARCQRHGISR